MIVDKEKASMSHPDLIYNEECNLFSPKGDVWSPYKAK